MFCGIIVTYNEQFFNQHPHKANLSNMISAVKVIIQDGPMFDLHKSIKPILVEKGSHSNVFDSVHIYLTVKLCLTEHITFIMKSFLYNIYLYKYIPTFTRYLLNLLVLLPRI